MSGKRTASATGEKNEPFVARTIAPNLLPTGIYFITIRIGDQYLMRKVIRQ